MDKIGRRALFQRGGTLGLGLATVAPFAKAAGVCGVLTPAQTPGPFYPVTRHSDEDADLTQVNGHRERALGKPIIITGTVRDLDCAPIPGAIVEIWQANTYGRYDHPSDTNPAPLDPNFQYWGRTTSDAVGAYQFKTILPGLYPGRTRHVHFRIVAPNYPTLVTQMYFAGEPRNSQDEILMSLTPDERQQVIVTFDGNEVLSGRFDITVGRVGTPGVTPELN